MFKLNEMSGMKQTGPCSNCGVVGHTFRQCHAPVLSYGLIVFRHSNPDWSLEKALCSSSQLLNGTEGAGGLQVLMIQRKDSLRFVEFVRGKYALKDMEYIKQLLTHMTPGERDLLMKSTFPELWNCVWGTMNPRNYRTDFEQSQEKFNELKSSGILASLLEKTEAVCSTPEWGFPKGRRNPYETDIDCAIRECMEETGLKRNQLQIFENMEPLCETFYGDNKVYYSHKYFPALVAPGTEVYMSAMNPHMAREIGNIQWMSIDDALCKIRTENIEKKEILLRASALFRNLCPFRNEKYYARRINGTNF
jgi:8-oxo-dGTP pyrophosphatase MutT (NUDIX family)